MTSAFDEWSEPGAEEYLKALGLMSLRYNHLEIALHNLVGSYFRGIPESVRDQLLIPLNSYQRLNLLRAIALEMEPLAEVQDLIQHFLQCFSICTNNRNIALHATGHKGETHFHFIKKRTTAPFDHNIYSVELGEIQAICNSMLDTQELAFAICRFVRSKPLQGLAWDWPIYGLVEIPRKPTLPHKLIPPRPGEFHPDGPILF